MLLQLLLVISENGRMPISGMQQQEQPMVVGLMAHMNLVVCVWWWWSVANFSANNLVCKVAISLHIYLGVGLVEVDEI